MIKIEDYHKHVANHYCELKTILLKEGSTIPDNGCNGTLFRYEDDNFTFIETPKHPDYVYKGNYIAASVQNHGEIHLDFIPRDCSELSSVEGYALNVANEIVDAVKGIIIALQS